MFTSPKLFFTFLESMQCGTSTLGRSNASLYVLMLGLFKWVRVRVIQMVFLLLCMAEPDKTTEKSTGKQPHGRER